MDARQSSLPWYESAVLFAREVRIAPDPVAIAARLAALGLEPSLLHAAERGAHGRSSFVAVLHDRTSEQLDPLADDDAPVETSGPFRGIPRWIGVIPYESRRALERAAWVHAETRAEPILVQPEWRRYRAVACVDHLTGRVTAVARLADDAGRLAQMLRREGALETPRIAVSVTPAEPPERHLERIAAGQALIRKGDLYQVNLARLLRVAVEARGSSPLAGPLALYQRLVRAAPTPFASFLTLRRGVTVLSTSPELLLRAEVFHAANSAERSSSFGRLLTVPIKGTRPRGVDARSDAFLTRALDEDPKERAELAMIVDVERNDLARVSEVGSVRVGGPPRVVTHRTVHHREAVIASQARAGVSREDVLAAMVPSGSVTGAPKVRAMEVIASLEAHRRGLYTGALGFVAHDGSVTLAMAIRTLVLREGEGEYFTGGGIVVDSDPRRELEETGWKALQLQRAVAELAR